MSIAELEALNIKLTNDNECYHKANRELMNELALAKAPAEVLISPHGNVLSCLRMRTLTRRIKEVPQV